MLQFEDKFLSIIFPSELHRKLCLRAREKATVKESYIKDYALTCYKFSEYLRNKIEQREEGLSAAISRSKNTSVIRSMIEALEYDEDFAFKLVTRRFYIDKRGEEILSTDLKRYKEHQKIEVYPYLDVCKKALKHTTDLEKSVFIHDCVELARLIISRGVKR